MIPEQYVKSGKITRDVKTAVRSKVKPGLSYLEVCRFVEKEILTRGGEMAFPVGIGVNQVTAHYAPGGDDRSVLDERDVVKVDFGVHVDGYVTDTAVSMTFNSDYELLLEAGEKALNAAIAMAQNGTRTGEIGGEIQKVATRFGFKTIQNLTGHTLDRYVVHAGKSIPNLYVPGTQALRKGDVFAIEPFVTLGTAAGYVVDAPSQTIFSVIARKKTGASDLDAFVARVWEERKTLPFTPRWYADGSDEQKTREMVYRLVAKRILRAYPTLVEASGKPVAQFEHTMALDESGLRVLT